MATAEATREFSTDTKALGDKIVGLTLKAAKELSDYLDEVHGIKPAAGGAVMMLIIFMGLAASNSRSGIFLGMLALTLSTLMVISAPAATRSTA